MAHLHICFFFFSSRRRHTRSLRDWSSDVCSSDLAAARPHEGVTDAAKVDPHVGQLVREERARIEQLAIVDRLPLIGGAVGAIALRRRSEERRVGKEWRGRWAAWGE